MTSAPLLQRPVGELLRQWRERRRLSQLDLSVQAAISTRHLSFVETGRATPSREMVLHLAEQLDIPLRERNQLLLAAGYAPVYGEASLADPQLSVIRDAVRQLLTGHEPYPAVVVDRNWQLLEANSSVSLFVDRAEPDLLAPPINVLRLSLHPGGLAPYIVNLGEWRAHLLRRLQRQVEATADPGLSALYEELDGYPCDDPEPVVDVPGPGSVVVPMRIRHDGRELRFLSTVATFGTPLDITVAELVIESFFPADAETASTLHSLSRAATRERHDLPS